MVKQLPAVSGKCILFITVALAVVAPVINGQDNAPAESNCESPGAHQFDFWLGEWGLTWDEDQRGTNNIIRVLGDCVIMEQFDGSPSIPLKGMSVSTYNSETGKWHQTWVDNNGTYLDFTGEFKDGKMILSRQAVRNGESFLQRMVWYNIKSQSLEWNWERSDDGGRTWETLWHIYYKRK